MKTVEFKKRTYFTGRNGTFISTGVELTTDSFADVVAINPITSRKVTGNCEIAIPINQVPELIKALQALTGAQC